LLRGSIRVGWLVYAAAVLWQIAAVAGRLNHLTAVRRYVIWWRLWAVGCLALAVHTWAAFEYVHHWSHASAVQETARQTGEMMGWEFGNGILFSYALLAIWTLDVLWSARHPLGPRLVPTGLQALVHAYIFFIVLNGVVTFQHGWYRWTGAGLLAMTAWGAWQGIRYRSSVAV
jgi:hypothetical protein